MLIYSVKYLGMLYKESGDSGFHYLVFTGREIYIQFMLMYDNNHLIAKLSLQVILFSIQMTSINIHNIIYKTS